MGVAGLFKRAVEAHAEKNTPVAAGVQLTTCSHCGAPRQRAELVCHFCEEKL